MISSVKPIRDITGSVTFLERRIFKQNFDVLHLFGETVEEKQEDMLKGNVVFAVNFGGGSSVMVISISIEISVYLGGSVVVSHLVYRMVIVAAQRHMAPEKVEVMLLKRHVIYAMIVVISVNVGGIFRHFSHSFTVLRV